MQVMVLHMVQELVMEVVVDAAPPPRQQDHLMVTIRCHRRLEVEEEGEGQVVVSYEFMLLKL